MMSNESIKVSICYHAQKGDEELILQSLRTIPFLKEKHKNFNFDVLIAYDCDGEELSLDEDREDYKIIPLNLRQSSWQYIEDIYNFYDSLNSDFVIHMNCDTALFTLESLEANLRRARQTLKENNLGMTFSANGGLVALGKQGIKNVLHALKNNLIQKRLSNRKHLIADIPNVLMEMCPLIMNKFDALEGVKGHCIDGKDNLERAASIGFNRNVKRMREFLDVFLSKKVVLPIAEFIKDKTVAIVGNADVDKDYSQEIDNHDVVIRVNNFYNYDSGNVGKKVSALLLSGTSAWMNEAPKGQSLHEEVISSQKPFIFLLTETSNQKVERLHVRYKDCKRVMLGNKTSDLRYTSGTVLLKMIAEVGGYKKVSLYGFDKGQNWKNYVGKDATIHDKVFTEEEQLRIELFKKLCYV